ncbi:uncharacterized protein si:dkey-21c1.4 isoform X2 [Boleophthalmus pectinirostris]|uniref:uncharacterized protein si:dkey-21c1.4 isoform X2 n=1 Tax=Boleophthalmus pectinirostris TaxID=150288 RepID=UPI00242DCC0D|nr:uncharacterized protein si:dkey-21c1.4 isoform X2 [Boleophthalmus pectinirostris]
MSKNEITASESEDFLSKVLKTENRACSFSGGFVISSDALRMDRHSLGFAAESRPLTTILQAEVSTEAFRKDLTSTLNQTVNKTVNDAETTTTTTRDAQRRDEGRTTRDVLKQQRLAHVTLRELPDWLVVKAPRRPADVMDAAQRGWRWYYRRYIDVKRGGVGGVAMLLAGYCVLSYVWNFPRLKRERWRKFH